MDEDKKEEKIRISALIDADLVRWVDEMVEKKIFAHRSHGIERALWELRMHPELLGAKDIIIVHEPESVEDGEKKKKPSPSRHDPKQSRQRED